MDATKVIFIYGTPAVGKLTTAKELVKITGYKLLHNHLTIDLVCALFDRKSDIGRNLILKLRLEMLEIGVKEKLNGIIITGVYAHDFLYPNGKSDEWFVEELERITEKNGGQFYSIHLVSDKEQLLERVKSDDRREWRKMTDPEKLEKHLTEYDFSKDAPGKHHLTIDNTNKSDFTRSSNCSLTETR